MAEGTVVRAWRRQETAYLAVRVVEGGVGVEYIGAVPAAELVGMTPAQRKARLGAAVKAVRDAQEAEVDLGISGTVTL